MTESEWHAETMPFHLIVFLRARAKGRVDRAGLLYSITCCRLTWEHLQPHERSVAELLERYAALPEFPSANSAWESLLVLMNEAVHPIRRILRLLDLNWWIISQPITSMTQRGDLTETMQCEILRDIVGNPFREVTFDPEWRSESVVALTESITNGDYTHYPILADALLDAGCRDDSVLDHCRQPGRHFKHCWVIEGLLKPQSDAVGNG